MCELARNSVLMSGFPKEVVALFLNYLEFSFLLLAFVSVSGFVRQICAFNNDCLLILVLLLLELLLLFT